MHRDVIYVGITLDPKVPHIVRTDSNRQVKFEYKVSRNLAMPYHILETRQMVKEYLHQIAARHPAFAVTAQPFVSEGIGFQTSQSIAP